MKLKLDDAGNAVLKDGNPVYVTGEGKEIALDAGSLYATVAELGVAKISDAQKLEQAKAQLKKFEGIDLEKINKTVATADETSKAFQTKLDEAEAARKALETQLSTRIKSGMFASSAFIGAKRPENLPNDYYEAVFSNNFKVGADGTVEAFDAAGKPIMSRSNPAQMAGFDEAIEHLISAHPQAASLIKGTVVSGTGTPVKSPAPQRAVTRAAFDAMSPTQRDEVLAAGSTIN